MAKQKLDIFTRKDTGEQPEQEQAPDPVKPVGIGLRSSEWERLEQIAGELGMKRGALAAYALRDFLRRWEAGEIKTETKKHLPGA